MNAHRYISTDHGLECFACGIVLDFMSPDDDLPPSLVWPDPQRDALEDAARSLAFGLCTPNRYGRSHHYVLEASRCPSTGRAGAYALQCAYDSTRVDALTDPTTVDPVCPGDDPTGYRAWVKRAQATDAARIFGRSE